MNQPLPPAITIEKLHVRYKQHWLFDQLNFHLPAQKWTCLLGPSGVGKTTLLRFIAGLKYEKDTEYFGKIITSDNQSLDKRTTYMAQQDVLMPWLNVLDNVLIGCKLRNEKITSQLKQTAIDLLEHAGLKNIIQLKPKALSGGMRQRVALVRALFENRPVILMDEPFSSLDVITRLKLQNLASKLLANRTVLLVTHDPLEALRLGDYIYTMTGSPAKISEPIKLQGTTPRDPTNIALLEQHAKLLELLTKNSEET
jgi:ABC-type nitrate/sulfonate/bicarbonate transport system, ATPase component